MTILILAAGYATRLYPLTLNTPKPLLKVGDKAILERIFEKIFELAGVERCYIVTNEKFCKDFKEWASDFSVSGEKSNVLIEVINDETTSNETRLGAIRDIEFVVKKKGIEDDLLVIGGDNLFEFSLRDFVDFAKAHKPNASLALFDIKENKKARLYGVAKIDSSKKLVDFKEKPAQPESTLIATCLYYFPKERLNLILKYIASGNKQDAPGNYIKWLSENEGAYGFVFEEDWYDIGDIKSYEEADERYKK
jgi:glucose-1-phosphate thymidylyltransferase